MKTVAITKYKVRPVSLQFQIHWIFALVSGLNLWTSKEF